MTKISTAADTLGKKLNDAINASPNTSKSPQVKNGNNNNKKRRGGNKSDSSKVVKDKAFIDLDSNNSVVTSQDKSGGIDVDSKDFSRSDKNTRPAYDSNSKGEAEKLEKVSVDYKREERSKVGYFTDSPSFPVDALTERKHAPLINEVIKVYVTGSDGSILSRIFSTCMENFLTLPSWYGGNLQVEKNLNIKVLKSYFDLLGDYIACYYISLNIIKLYEDYHDNRRFEHDPVMQSLLSDYFSNFTPKRKQFTLEVENIKSRLEKYFLPNFFVEKVENAFKFTSLPYHGFEVICTKSILLSVPTNIFDRNFDFKQGMSSNNKLMTINFPFDKTICYENGETYSRMIRILRFLVNKLEYMIKYNGEFTSLNSTFTHLCSEWSIKVKDSDSYDYIKHMSAYERINLLNTPLFSVSKVVCDSFIYQHQKESSIVEDSKDASNLTNVIFSTKFNCPLATSLVEASIDDILSSNGCRWTINRYYGNYPFFHDSDGGFSITPDEFIYATLAYATDVSNPTVKAMTPKFILEPGLMSPFPSPNGLHLLYCFFDKVCASPAGCVNVEVPNVSETTIIDYFSSIARRTCIYYKHVDGKNYIDLNSNVISSDQVSPYIYYSSHPTIRRGGLNLNSILIELQDIFRKAWCNTSLDAAFNLRFANDVKSEFKLYKTVVITDNTDYANS